MFVVLIPKKEKVYIYHNSKINKRQYLNILKGQLRLFSSFWVIVSVESCTFLAQNKQKMCIIWLYSDLNLQILYHNIRFLDKQKYLLHQLTTFQSFPLKEYCSFPIFRLPHYSPAGKMQKRKNLSKFGHESKP